MEHLIERFNSFLQGRAKVEIVGDQLEITIGNETLMISLPQFIGAKSRASS